MKRKKLTQKEQRQIVESVVGKAPWEKFTPGIYNNCDRWCEKCKKTGKCYLYFEEQKEKRPRSLGSALNKAEKSLDQVKDLIQKICDAEGIDLTMTPEEESEYEKKERLTDPHSEPVAIKAKKISKTIYDWLDSVPSLDIAEYRVAYEQVLWHWPMVGVNACMAVHCMKESKIEKGQSKKFAKQQQTKYSGMAYRSTLICKNSLELMDRYVGDFRIRPMIDDCRDVINLIDQELLSP